MGLLSRCDLVALNRDEAAALAQMNPEGEAEHIARGAVDRLRHDNGAVMVSVTAGGDGSWAWDGGDLHHLPALPVEVASTAGAGDCHLGCLLAGLAANLSLAEAQHLAGLAAAHSVTSPHTIDDRIDRPTLAAFAELVEASLPAGVREFLATGPPQPRGGPAAESGRGEHCA